MKIYGFMHVYMTNNWKEIVRSQISKMKKSGLWYKMDKLFVGYIDKENLYKEDPLVFREGKIKVMYNSTDPTIYESLTLSFLQHIAQTDGESIDGCFFYIHTKGVTHMNSPFQRDWRELMEYFIIEKYESCLRELKNNDIVGVNWHLGEGYMGARSGTKYSEGTQITPHFSGNFWWANTPYIRRLPNLIPLKGRYECEFWIGKANPKVAELWCSGKHHHKMLYPKSHYEGKENVRYLNG